MFDLTKLTAEERHALVACVYEVLFQRQEDVCFHTQFTAKYGTRANDGMYKLQERIEQRHGKKVLQ